MIDNMGLIMDFEALQTEKNQRIENASVAFVKKANEGNEFFEKINKLMYDELVPVNKAKD